MPDVENLTAGLALASAVAVLAWRARALTMSGAVAAIVMGTLAVAAGWSWAMVLIGYFISSTLLSRYRSRDKEARTSARLQKTGARDATQVLANGGVFAVAALGHWLAPDALWHSLAAGGLAASAADTWATEIGTLSSRPPRSILGGETVPVGSSGGVTTVGLAAGAAGALFVGVLGYAAGWPAATTVAALVGGVFGCLLDSLLGATVQSRRWCGQCATGTERMVHSCGTTTSVIGGVRWIGNDGVNALSTIGGALFGATASRYF